jgi:hypothetical protein
MNVTKTKPYYNVKSFPKWNFWEVLAIDKTWPTIDKILLFLLFISENNRYSRCLYKFWNKNISFDMNKRGNLKQIIGKMKKKVNLNP